ncbi:hypothetical protein CBM2600_B40018 [Cupriavidus taiwanensis]|nr:hypothetical protein CBM2600_B40018 [Cupriavidus taiwanensis]
MQLKYPLAVQVNCLSKARTGDTPTVTSG